jgi:dissimilatory sulfite reductase (desulfoviridin) alpha/beta subunit
VANQHELKNGLLFVLAESAGGIYNGEQLRKICEAAQDDSVILKVTEDQCLGFMLEPSRLDGVRELLEPSGLHLRLYRAPGAPAPKACLGELCPFAVQDALGDSIELGATLAERFGDATALVRIGVNGCDRACVGSAIDDVHVVAEDTGYKIAIGGKSAELPQPAQFLIDNVSKENLTGVLCRVLETYYNVRQDGESLLDVLEREGMGVFTRAAEGTVEESGSTDVASGDDVSTDDVSDDATLGVVTPDESNSLLEENVGESQEELSIGNDTLDNVQIDNVEIDNVEIDNVEIDNVEIDNVEIDNVEIDNMNEAELNIDEIEIDNMELDSEMAEVSEVSEGDVLNTPSLEVDVDTELTGVVEATHIAAEVNADLDVELGDTDVVDVDEHIAANDAVSMNDLAQEDSNLTFEEAGVEDVGRMTAALQSEAAQSSPHLEPGKASASLQSIVPEELVAIDETLEDSGASALEQVEKVQEPAVAAVSSDLDMDMMEEESIPLTSALDDTDAESSKLSEASQSDEQELPKPLPMKAAAKGRLRLKLGEHDVKIVLPNGIECGVPMAWVEENGVFEMDIGESTLTVEKINDSLQFRYGALVLTVPVMAVPVAA